MQTLTNDLYETYKTDDLLTLTDRDTEKQNYVFNKIDEANKTGKELEEFAIETKDIGTINKHNEITALDLIDYLTSLDKNAYNTDWSWLLHSDEFKIEIDGGICYGAIPTAIIRLNTTWDEFWTGVAATRAWEEANNIVHSATLAENRY